MWSNTDSAPGRPIGPTDTQESVMWLDNSLSHRHTHTCTPFGLFFLSMQSLWHCMLLLKGRAHTALHLWCSPKQLLAVPIWHTPGPPEEGGWGEVCSHCDENCRHKSSEWVRERSKASNDEWLPSQHLLCLAQLVSEVTLSNTYMYRSLKDTTPQI